MSKIDILVTPQDMRRGIPGIASACAGAFAIVHHEGADWAKIHAHRIKGTIHARWGKGDYIHHAMVDTDGPEGRKALAVLLCNDSGAGAELADAYPEGVWLHLISHRADKKSAKPPWYDHARGMGAHDGERDGLNNTPGKSDRSSQFTTPEELSVYRHAYETSFQRGEAKRLETYIWPNPRIQPSKKDRMRYNDE